MQFGAAMFFTDYSMGPAELGAGAGGARVRVALGAGAFAHPVSRTTPFPGGGDLPKQYYDVMDPFVTLTAAAAATKTLKLGTGVCLVAQRDPIQTAKLVASIDQVSGGRFLFGVGNGWNAEEMADHGTVFATRHKLARERVEAMKAIWTQAKAGIPRRVRRFRPDDGVAEAGAEAASAGHRRRRFSLWRAPGDPLRRRLDAATPAGRNYGDVGEFLPQFRQMAMEAGRDPASLPITIFRVEEDLDRLRHYRDLGVARAVISVPAARADEVLPLLDRWAALIARL